ncbi:MAG: TraB/GumN family protein [Pseudomonadota bacterium]|nr:TraB/GumN family protein [Pseudomonadota bacterium]
MKNRVIALLYLLIGLVNISQADTSVWKVSQGDHYFYLGGTFHMLAPEDYPLEPEYMQAYQDADRLYFETDMAAANAPEFLAQAQKDMLLQGQTLNEVLKPKVYTKVEAYIESRQLSMSMFNSFKPDAVMLALATLEYMRLGNKASLGVDTYFQKLNTTKKEYYFETPEEQMAFLSSFGDEDPNELVTLSLDQLSTLGNDIERIKMLWRNGLAAELYQYYKETSDGHATQAMDDVLIKQRNLNWMNTINTFMESSEVEFVLVGALHMGGPNGLIALLEHKGYQVKQL